MKENYWLERWKQDEIGFHQSETNTHLIHYWRKLNLIYGSKIFVPLCGKSVDMLWLHKQGYMVLGVELSAVAIRAFFEENYQAFNYINGEKFNYYESSGISILGGNFFDLTKKDLAKVSAVYDRASLIALPITMRANYTRHLLSILPPSTQILLITLDYPQSEMSGPPFAVSEDEVKELYGKHTKICHVAQFDVLERYPRFQERGVSRLDENIFLLNIQDEQI